MSQPNTAHDLLAKCAKQFRYYAQNHRAKVPALERKLGAADAVRDTLAKAQVNEDLAKEIEDFLADERTTE